MIDHLSIQVHDVAASAAFYDAVLMPLGGKRLMDMGEVIGLAARSTILDRPRDHHGRRPRGHIAFVAADRAAVNAFHEAALAAGAEVLHEPRVWPEYHPTYYGAFVRDPDGNNVEAVCHTPPEGTPPQSPPTD
jgi:catechol 2,3-dioxygenase-like lactoylglutathione lyase family enzyme